VLCGEAIIPIAWSGLIRLEFEPPVNGLELIGVSGKPDLTNSESMAMKMFIHISDAVLIVTIHIL
jgi:hypothetical protein